MYYTFNKTDKGYIGKAFEMAIKNALNRKNADKVSAQGKSDFRFCRINYEVKQNGSCIQYRPNARYISGSSRVIYATHIAYNVVAEDADTITICVDLANTDMYVVDRNAFIEFLLTHKGAVKVNKERETVNIQTVYNYKRNAYHGKLGKVIEAWAAEHELDDDILGIVWDGLEG